MKIAGIFDSSPNVTLSDSEESPLAMEDSSLRSIRWFFKKP